MPSPSAFPKLSLMSYQCRNLFLVYSLLLIYDLSLWLFIDFSFVWTLWFLSFLHLLFFLHPLWFLVFLIVRKVLFFRNFLRHILHHHLSLWFGILLNFSHYIIVFKHSYPILKESWQHINLQLLLFLLSPLFILFFSNMQKLSIFLIFYLS